MERKISGLDALSSGKLDEAAKKGAKEQKPKGRPPSKEKLPRTLVKIAPDAHQMAKVAGVLSGGTMQSYIEDLIRKDFKANYPTQWKKTMAEIKDKYPLLFSEVMEQSKGW